jgi:hypothetical protein
MKGRGQMNTGLKKTLAGVLLLCLVLLLIPLHVQAKLTILPPDKMLEQADVIAAGTVEKLESSGEQTGLTGTIRIDSVMKGSLESDRVILTETRYMTGASLQQIPPASTNVLLLLKKDDHGNPGYFADANHIAVIENGRVTDVYKGTNISTQPYVETYDAYYQQHKGQALSGTMSAMPVAPQSPDGPVQERPAITVLKDRLISESGQKILGGAAVVLVVALIVWYELRVGRDRRSR